MKTAEEKKLAKLSAQLRLLELRDRRAKVPYEVFRFREASKTQLKRRK